MNNDLIYVYCLANCQPDLGDFEKIENLKSLRFDDIFVVMKHVSETEFSEENFKKNLSNIEWLDAKVRDHLGVINQIMENNAVIPFKFGTIFQSEDNLKIFIADYSGSLTRNFAYIAGKEEWSVKVYCDRKMLCKQIDELSEEAAFLEKQIMESSPGRAYLLRRKKTDLIEYEMDRICKNYGQEYFDKFKNLSEAYNLNNLLPKEFTGREDTMILNATFLVEKIKVTELKGTVESIAKKDANSGFFIEESGPWPPFSFISIKEKKS